MKRILLSLVTVLFAICTNAQTEFTWSAASDWSKVNDNAAVITYSKDGYTVTINKENGQSNPVINETANDARAYAKATVTVSSASEMTTITFNISAQGLKRLTDITANSGNVTYGETTVTWEGKAKEVVFTVGEKATRGTDGEGKAGQLCFNSITFGGDVPEEVEPEKPVDISNTPETAYTTTKAIELIDAGKGLGTKVYVKGEIKSVTEISTDFGNATYIISDGTKDLTVYRGFSLGGDKFTNEDEIQDGDEVIVYGELTLYKDTYEVTTGSQIYSLNGKTKADQPEEPKEEYTLVGKGTLENPYTVEDIIKGVYEEGKPVEKVWVKGIIYGCFVSSKTPIATEEKDMKPSNISLGNEEKTAFIPVQLLMNGDKPTPAREALNVIDNPENIGKTAWIAGDVDKYFSVAGLKNVFDYTFDGTIEVGIQAIVVDNANGGIFNLAGQRLSAPQKGINIINGKKIFVK